MAPQTSTDSGAGVMAGLLTTWGKADLRAKMTAALPDICTISRNTPVGDGAGGSVDAWATLSTTACTIAPTGNQPQERAIADRITTSQGYTVTLPAETPITTRDRIIKGGRLFEVAGVLERTEEISRRVVVVEVL